MDEQGKPNSHWLTRTWA